MPRIALVRKRDGRLVPFDLRRVADAIYRAAESVGGEDRFLAEELAGVVGLYLERSHAERIPSVADIEDAVERVLVDTGHARTAKAFILHRDRRAAARERVRIEEDGGERPLPLVGSDQSGRVSRWSKSRIAAALVSEAGLPPPVADEVARAVEGRVLAGGLVRIPSSLVRALVDAELFARGHVNTIERQRVVGVPKHDLSARLAEAGPARRRLDPAALLEAVGEDVVRPYVLEEVVPAAAAEAHRVGEIHLYDLGYPFAPTSYVPPSAPFFERRLLGDTTPRAGGPRRAGHALAAALSDGGGRAARAFAMEDVNVLLAPFLSRLDEDGLREEVREVLLSPAVRSFPRRGGLLALEWTLASEVPARLVSRPVPPPAPPGATYGDFEDAARHVLRAILDVTVSLAREGMGDRLPSLTFVVRRDAAKDAASRSLLVEALSAAALCGEPRFAFDAPGLPQRGSRWLRIHPDEGADPLRSDGGDVVVATVGAVNLAAAALKAGRAGEEALPADIARAVSLVLDAAVTRVEFLLGRGPGGSGGVEGATTASLFPGLGPAAGSDLEGAVHLVEPVGADRAAVLLSPGGSAEERRALRTRLVGVVKERAFAAGNERGIAVAVAEAPAAEACVRLAEVDAARFDTAAGWWEEGRPISYGAGGPSAEGTWREPLGPGKRAGSGPVERVVRRVDPSHPPAAEDLLSGWERAASDPSVLLYALDPWPRRFLKTTD